LLFVKIQVAEQVPRKGRRLTIEKKQKLKEEVEGLKKKRRRKN
jgi:hypothetical protein